MDVHPTKNVSIGIDPYPNDHLLRISAPGDRRRNARSASLRKARCAGSWWFQVLVDWLRGTSKLKTMVYEILPSGYLT
jgi:hypothetical protein